MKYLNLYTTFDSLFVTFLCLLAVKTYVHVQISVQNNKFSSNSLNMIPSVSTYYLTFLTLLKIVYNYYTLEQCLDTSLFEAVKMLNDQLVAV